MATTRLPTIPESIVVHLGKPDQQAENVTVPFIDYIKNVASSEIYPTWPDASLRANIYAIITFALNRMYTEYYPSRGYDFDITSSTQFDQSFQPGRDIFQNISRIVDDIFNSYVRKQGSIEPYFTAFCNGTTVQCDGLSQWGTVALAQEGYNSYRILQHYYGDDIDIVQNVPIQNIEDTYPGTPLRMGDASNAVKSLQDALVRIRRNYPAIPNIYSPAGASGLSTEPDGVFGVRTEAAVKEFQKIFNLEADGVVGKATWYQIRRIYNGVKKLNELTSEGLRLDELEPIFPTRLDPGDTGIYVRMLQYYLSIIRYNYNNIPEIQIDGVYGPQTQSAVFEFQRVSGLPTTGLVDQRTIDELMSTYRDVVATIPAEVFGTGSRVYPGMYLEEGFTGENVYIFQSYLSAIADAYPEIPKITADGVFGPGTVRAVQAIQRMFGYPQTGDVGPVTWYTISQLYESL